MDHSTTRATMIPLIVTQIMERFGYDERKALDVFYRSKTGAALADDDTGLYGQSPNYIFGLFCEEMGNQSG